MIRKTNGGRNLQRHSSRYIRNSRLNESFDITQLQFLEPGELYHVALSALYYIEDYLADLSDEDAISETDNMFVDKLRRTCNEICRITGNY